MARGARRSVAWADLPVRTKGLVVVAIPLGALLVAVGALYFLQRVQIQAELLAIAFATAERPGEKPLPGKLLPARLEEFLVKSQVALNEIQLELGYMQDEEDRKLTELSYAAIGSVTNLASRLCDEAKPEQILISQRVYASVEDLVAVEAVGDLPLKGFARPIAVYNVLALRNGVPA